MNVAIGSPSNFPGAAEKIMRQFATGHPAAVGIDGVLYPVEAVDAQSLQQAIVNQMFPQTGGTMGDDWYDGEVVTPGQPTGPGVPAAPAGGWCFRTINGKLTAIACNQVSNNSPQGTFLSSSDVRSIQARLNQLPSSLPRLSVDGMWGPKTAERVGEFQAMSGLPATRVMDATTRSRLFSAQPIVTPTANNAGTQLINNAPPPGSSFNLSSLFSGMDATTLLLIALGVVVVATRN